jgi:3-phosphoshikimate 1-carboxyvinyltransferase
VTHDWAGDDADSTSGNARIPIDEFTANDRFDNLDLRKPETDHMKISRAKYVRGRVSLPGDKSISHRAAMLAAIADGTTTITNFGSSADCASTLSCFAHLGVPFERDGSTVIVRGKGKFGLRKAAGALDCGNSGTTVRLIAGILAGQDFETVLTGDESLSSRPMKRIIAPLERMGARVGSADGRLPLRIRGARPLSAIDYVLPVASAQVKSCVLLAGLYADGTTSVTEPGRDEVPRTMTRDHTERMLKWFGANVQTDGQGRASVSGDSVLRARDIRVPGDVSAAAFFLVAASCLPGSDLIIENVGLNPTRTAVIDVLRRFGAAIAVTGETEVSGEPAGDVRVGGGNDLSGGPGGNVIDGEVIANLIDEIPILAVFGTQVEGGIEVRGARELRVKESDRINSIVVNLRRMGAKIEEFDDGFRVARSRLSGGVIDSFGDHRIAMAFAVAGLMADGETEIVDAGCAAVSFPEFCDVLRSVAVTNDE